MNWSRAGVASKGNKNKYTIKHIKKEINDKTVTLVTMYTPTFNWYCPPRDQTASPALHFHQTFYETDL